MKLELTKYDFIPRERERNMIMREKNLFCLISAFLMISLVVSATVSAQSTAGLVFAMTFEEGSGNTVHDLSGNGNHGEAIGSAEWGAGKYGGGFHFDGATYITVPNAAPLSSLTHPMSVGLWINPDELGGWRSILEMDGAAGWKIGTHDGTDAVVWTTYFVKDFVAVTPIVAGEWTHIAAAWDGAEVLIYVNGDLDDAIAGGGVIDVSAEPSLDIGYRSSSASSYYAGYVDDVFIFNRVLSQQEVADQMGGFSETSVEPGGKAATAWGALKY